MTTTVLLSQERVKLLPLENGDLLTRPEFERRYQAMTHILKGGLGNDTLEGGTGDSWSGEKSNDYLDGGEDNDRFLGSAGNDTLTGGQGQDTFSYLWHFTVDIDDILSHDVITDFEIETSTTGGDKLEFNNNINFNQLNLEIVNNDL